MATLDEEYQRRMDDILELYERPLNPDEPVLCLDEKPVRLRDDLVPPQPPQPGRSARRDYEYRRCGTANVFCVVEPRGGRHFNRATPNRTGREFARLLRDLAARYPGARTIHLVLDNLSTHARTALVRAFGREHADRIWSCFTLHYTPNHGSWLNPAEIEVSLLSRQCLGHRRIPTFARLRREVCAWNRSLNRAHLKIGWRFSRERAHRTLLYRPARI